MKKTTLLIVMMLVAAGAYGQGFEESVPGNDTAAKPKVQVGGNFALQLQFLNHHADSTLIPLGKGMNVPTANLNLDAVLADGIEVSLTTYLSSRHHLEAWVKGGYLLIDKLPFINSPAVTRAMDFLTFKAGVMEINYGDAHFRRSDNGNVIRNSFVGNYIMDAFTTAPAIEGWYRNKGFLVLAGLTNGTLDPVLTRYNAGTQTYSAINMGKELAFYWKAGYDKQVNDNFRIRATMSGYHAANNHSGSLYFGDRTGSRYYLVMNLETNSPNDVDPSVNHLSGNFGPGFTDRDNSLMWNLLAKLHGAEFFGSYELATGTSPFTGNSFRFHQYAAEGIYHFGHQDQFYGGVRYNRVGNSLDNSVGRIQVAAGWFPIPEVLVKAEYVNQQYKNFAIYGSNAGFDGFMLEATVSF